MRVFFDTNVLLAAELWPGLCRQVFELVLVRHEVLVGEPVLGELAEKLREKFHVPLEQIRASEALLRRQHVEPVPAILPEVEVRDPDDWPILGCALAAGADVLVTGDGDLLTLQGQVAVAILTPRELWERLNATE